MLIIPERELVLITPPRTGSTSLAQAIKHRYPKTMHPYRHMEATGVPAGYDRFRRLCIVRDPMERLWSLYNYCKTMDGEKYCQLHLKEIRASVDMPFEEWLIENRIPFSTPHSRTHGFLPYYNVSCVLAENLKSQYWYARPDLGGDVWPFAWLGQLFEKLDMTEHFLNGTVHRKPPPKLSDRVARQMHVMFQWDTWAANGLCPVLPREPSTPSILSYTKA